MGLLEELKELGVDVDGALERLKGKEDLYIRLLGIFVKTMEEQYVSPDFDGTDYRAVAEKAHNIKGTSGNMSITPIYDAYTRIVDLLRKERPEEARMILRDVLPVQNEIIACIKKHQSEQS